MLFAQFTVHPYDKEKPQHEYDGYNNRIYQYKFHYFFLSNRIIKHKIVGAQNAINIASNFLPWRNITSETIITEKTTRIIIQFMIPNF